MHRPVQPVADQRDRAVGEAARDLGHHHRRAYADHPSGAPLVVVVRVPRENMVVRAGGYAASVAMRAPGLASRSIHYHPNNGSGAASATRGAAKFETVTPTNRMPCSVGSTDRISSMLARRSPS